MSVEFLGTGAFNDASEINNSSGPFFDPEYTVRLARAHEDFGWDRVLVPYFRNAPDPMLVAGHIAGHTERLGLMVAHRPNVSHPTYAAKMLATLDQISGG